MVDGRKKILCIEDDHETAALIAEELIDRGFAVSVAHDGGEGYSAILRESPDLVLSDVNLPVLSGFDVLERLTACAPRFAGTPFVFVSANAEQENALNGRKLGADEYVTKPIDFDQLGTLIAARLQRVARA
jgi:DNA-binding response OmpR family regulator